jgi:hypothetical protein
VEVAACCRKEGTLPEVSLLLSQTTLGRKVTQDVSTWGNLYSVILTGKDAGFFCSKILGTVPLPRGNAKVHL